MRAWLLRGTLALSGALTGGCLVSDVYVDGPGDAAVEAGAGGSGGGAGAAAGGAAGAAAQGGAGATGGVGATGGTSTTGGAGGSGGGPSCNLAACPTDLGVAACCQANGECGYRVGDQCFPEPSCDPARCDGIGDCCTEGEVPVCGRTTTPLPDSPEGCEPRPLPCGAATCLPAVVGTPGLRFAEPCCADAAASRCGVVAFGTCWSSCDLAACDASPAGQGCCAGANLEQCGVRTAGQCQPGPANPCSPSPCQNGGTCQPMGGTSYVCQCPAAWSGPRCEQPAASPCSPNPCVNGSCTEAAGTSYCNCAPGWGGQWCEVPQCTAAYCQNGGTCSVVGGLLTCTCPVGFGGPTCGTASSPCIPNPCLHGTCSPGVGGVYQCTCVAEWEGPNCDVVGDCAALPCQNGGQCTELPGANAFSCSCPVGFAGPRCETGTACTPNPCLYGGSCTQAGSGFSCACTPSRQGARCEFCAPGTGDCDGSLVNGCETWLASSSSHCGACGNACPQINGVSACVGGACVQGPCTTGWGNCDGLASNGCEASLSTVQHCGACFAACSSYGGVSSCSGGACSIACNAGYDDCDGRADTGCEVDLTSVTDCGACANVCSSVHGTPGCWGGSCAMAGCDTGWMDCDGQASTGCERSVRTLTDCGTCFQPCTVAHATASCDTGLCQYTACDPGWDDCNGVSSDGCETELTSAGACGACGRVCSSLNGVGTCVGGACQVTCSAGWGDCDGDPSNGCEANLNTFARCGSCGNGCLNLPHRPADCVNYACVSTCDAGWGDCNGGGFDGCEVDLATESDHCGACGVACRVGGVRTVCADGACTTDVRATEVMLWELDVPGPWLALWESGDVLAAGAASALLVDRDTGVGAARPGLTSRPALFLDGTAASCANGGYQGRQGVHRDGTLAWQWPDLGCCNSEAAPLLIDPAGRAAWVSANGGLSRVSVDTGVGAGVVSGGVWGGVDSARGDRHWVAGFQGALSLYDRAAPAHLWSATLDAGVRLLPGAVASGGAFVVASASGRIARYLPTGGTAWNYTAAPTTPPVIDESDTAYVGTAEPSVIAITATGAEVWRFPLLDAASDLLVADDGTLHVLDAGGTITVLVRADGSVQRRYVGLRPGGGELVLRGGVLHATSGNRLYALDVVPTGYPSNAAWPVRHHDSQRTGSGDAILTW